MSLQGQDLGFSHIITKAGEVRITHHGRCVTILRGREAQQFCTRKAALPFGDIQQALARITGKYKHGNEKK